MIGLVFCGDLRYCPYLSRYTERLELFGVPHVVLFWNRGGYKIQLKENYIGFNNESALESNKIKKTFDFVAFRTWAIKQLEQRRADKIIVLSTLSGVILARHLYHEKKGQYIFDIRDYSYEHIKPVMNIEKELIKNSCFTAISSDGFKSFLPEHDYVLAHNFNRMDIRKKIVFRKKTHGPIKMVWNGLIRYFEFQKQYIDALANDDRFQMVYHGDGPELVLYIRYCQDNNIRNTLFTGAYNNADKGKLLEDADILNNCYGYTIDAGCKLKYAVSNRFYDGIIYHKPQLVEPDGFKAIWTLKGGIGTNLKSGKGFADHLYQYYSSIDEDTFDSACDAMLQTIINDDDMYINHIDDFIMN